MQTGQKYLSCVRALEEFARGIGFTDVVIGLSGGIDSSVVAVMCADAFGADHVHGVLMPGPYSTAHSVDDAQQLAANLGIETRTVSICDAYEGFRRALDPALPEGLVGLAAENVQARCRMVTLMAFSNARGWMLVNTGNKSEAFMGYSTLYGDTAGAFAPLGGLYKRDVFAVGRWRNDEAKANGQVPPIPQHVFDKPPSAELSPNQEDETSMGVSYEMLDGILLASQEHGASRADLIAQGYQEADVDRVLSTAKATAFKRAMEPPYPLDAFYE